MKIGILGFGKEGKSTLKFIKKNNSFAEIEILDKKFSKNYLNNLERFDFIFRTPGIPYNSPEIQKAVKNGVNVSSATKLFFNEIKKMVRRGSPRVIGVTGTKGKGTVSTLIYKVLKACGKDVYLVGNIGRPTLEILPKLKSESVVVLELSSFQLQDLKKSPDIAVVLDIFPDHLDSHKNFKEYINAKSNIAKWQSAGRRKTAQVFYFADNKYSKWIAEQSRGEKIPVKINSGHSDKFGFSNRDLKIPGFHNFKNAVMAANIALSLGCPKEKIIRTIKNFRGLEHRLEFIRSIKIKKRTNNYSNILKNNRIDFYNDSASTNPQTAAAAVKSFDGSKILIAGGKDKKLDYKSLVKTLRDSETELVILFGENKKKIYGSIKKSGVNIELVKDLETAVETAYKTAKLLVANGYPLITILFSPASASFDMFKNYEERGKKFKEFVKKLK